MTRSAKRLMSLQSVPLGSLQISKITLGVSPYFAATFVDGRLAHERRNGDYTNAKDFSTIRE